MVAGWGLTEYGGKKATVLQVTSVNVYNLQQCKAILGNDVVLTQGEFCAYSKGHDACQVNAMMHMLLEYWTY